MKRFFILILLSVSLSLTSCYHHTQLQEPVHPVTKKEESPKYTTPDPTIYVPFTKDLYNRLKANNIDIRKVQFFTDQEILLSRNMDMNRTEVVSGVIKFSNGKNIDEIRIPIHTPGVCDSIDYDGLRINFERGSNDFKFINNKYSPDYFIFSGNNWQDGSCDVLYNRLVYRASCGTCSSAADIKLVIKQSDLDNTQKKTKVITGRNVDN